MPIVIMPLRPAIILKLLQIPYPHWDCEVSKWHAKKEILTKIEAERASLW